MKSPGGSGIQLAVLGEGEAGDLGAMAARIWPSVYGELLPPGQIEYMLGRMYSEETICRERREGVDYRWIEEEGERLGFLAFGPVVSGEVCPLHKCYLLETARGRGVGGSALGRLFGELEGAGVPCVELRVNRHNAGAIAFYQKNGFVRTAEDRLDIGGGFVMDDWILRRTLPR